MVPGLIVHIDRCKSVTCDLAVYDVLVYYGILLIALLKKQGSITYPSALASKTADTVLPLTYVEFGKSCTAIIRFLEQGKESAYYIFSIKHSYYYFL